MSRPLTKLFFSNNSIGDRSNNRQVFVISSGINGPSPLPREQEEHPDSLLFASAPQQELGGQQFYQIETGNNQQQRTILVPVRASTPPPTYSSLFG